jgi:uroporphyrinogen decarboxylase
MRRALYACAGLLAAPACAFVAVPASPAVARSTALQAAVKADAHDILVRVAMGEEAERPPVWLMRQAGRYMADFR